MSAPRDLPALLYQGGVNTWECDEGGHLNVRFQLERAMIGVAHLAHALAMPRAFAAGAGATLTPLDLHVRFLREARPGEALTMRGGVAHFEAQGATLSLDMRHGDGTPASAFTMRVAHVEPRTLRPFAWSARSRNAAAELQCSAPEHAAPRSIDIGRNASQANLARAETLGATRTGAFFVTPDQCDAFGRLRAEHVFGRVSDAVPTLLASWRRALAEEAVKAGATASPAGAVVEAHVRFLRWPLAGDLIEVRSALVELAGRTMRLGHWLLDPVSGAAWATIEVVALTFDTATRKTMTPSEDVRAMMNARAIPDFMAPAGG